MYLFSLFPLEIHFYTFYSGHLRGHFVLQFWCWLPIIYFFLEIYKCVKVIDQKKQKEPCTFHLDIYPLIFLPQPKLLATWHVILCNCVMVNSKRKCMQSNININKCTQLLFTTTTKLKKKILKNIDLSWGGGVTFKLRFTLK